MIHGGTIHAGESCVMRSVRHVLYLEVSLVQVGSHKLLGDATEQALACARLGRSVKNTRRGAREALGRPRTVRDFRARVAAVDAHVVVAGSRLDGSGGDHDAVLGGEQVEAQHHRSHGWVGSGLEWAWIRARRSGLEDAPSSTVPRNLAMSCTSEGVSSLLVSSRHVVTTCSATVSAVAPAFEPHAMGCLTKATGSPSFCLRLVRPPGSHAGCLKTPSSVRPKRTPSSLSLPQCQSCTCWCSGKPSEAPEPTFSETQPPSSSRASTTRMYFSFLTNACFSSVGMRAVTLRSEV
eukprot:scaffold55595_cov60-Phaeocystis_antarctica.AAC.6